MSIRNVILAPVLLTLAAGDAAAQPMAPTRPRASAFQTLFGPGSQVAPNFAPGGRFAPNPAGAAGANAISPQQALALDALTQVYGGPPVTFNNLSHYYSNYYGHWYPGGVTNGMGVTAGGGFGGGGGGIGMGAGTGAGVRGGTGGTFAPGTMTQPPPLGLGIRLGGGRR